MRAASVSRRTAETDVAVSVALDGTGKAAVSTGVGFFDHMLELLARHSLFDIEVKATGDLNVDQHHTVEDAGIALGQAFAKALGDKRGIARYADIHLPMDETLSRVALDISGRPFLVWKARFTQAKLGEWDTELIEHWFHSVAQAAGITLHVQLLYGQNNHHVCEAIYKGFARAMRQAVELDPRKGGAIPSTKGQLGG
jgi:imidazoleglycerol-phosphate dehydratase